MRNTRPLSDFPQYRRQFIVERFHPMMLFLIGDVPPYPIPHGRAHRKGGIAVLPGERLFAHGIVNPRGRILLHLPQHIREDMRGPEPHQQMDMVRRAADAFRKAAQAAHDPTEIFVQAGPPFRVNQRRAVLGAEYEVVMQAQVGGGHGGFV
jgi:hypothetical protein